MAMSFSERRAQQQAKKAQKRAEKQALKADLSGAQIAKKLAGKRLNLVEIDRAAAVFDEGGPVFDKLMKSPKHRGLYELAKDWLEGPWLENFRRMVNAIPAAERGRVHTFSWEDWKSYGERSGFDESGTEGVLRTLYVFKPA